MIKLFSNIAFQLLKNSSRLPPPKSSSFTKFYLSFSTSKTIINWKKQFPYTSILDEKTMLKALPFLKDIPLDEQVDFQKDFAEYIQHRDPSLLSEAGSEHLSMVIWKLGFTAQNVRNDIKEAEAYYREALDITKKSKGNNIDTMLSIQNTLGHLYCDLNQLDKALSCLQDVDNLIKEIPDFDDSDCIRVRNLYFTSKVYAKQGKQDQAIELLNKTITAIDNDPHALPTHLTTNVFSDLGRTYEEKGDIEKAFGVWEEGIRYCKQIYGEDANGLQVLYRLISEASLEHGDDTRIVKNITRSIELNKKYNQIKPNDFYTLAFAQFQLQDYEEFLKNAETFLDLTNNGPQLELRTHMYERICFMHCMQKNITPAEKAFGGLITTLNALHGENSIEVVDAYIERVEMLSGQEETAKSYYRTALTEAIEVSKNCENFDPKRMINLLLRAGESYANDEEWGQALEYFEKVQKLSPEKYLAQEGDQLELVYIFAAKAYCYLGKLQEGLVYIEKAKALCEASGDPHNRIAEFDESIKNIRESIKNA